MTVNLGEMNGALEKGGRCRLGRFGMLNFDRTIGRRGPIGAAEQIRHKLDLSIIRPCIAAIQLCHSIRDRTTVNHLCVPHVGEQQLLGRDPVRDSVYGEGDQYQ